jgi:hypothetical protein
MNWEALGAIGETLGAAAVFVTLAYLAVQVRHARRETQRALSQGRGEAIRSLQALFCDERINRVHVKANVALGSTPNPVVATLVNQAGLTREEAQLLVVAEVSFWSYVIQIIPNIDELSAIERTQFEIGVRARLLAPVGRLYYEFQKDTAHPDAIRYVDGVLARAA